MAITVWASYQKKQVFSVMQRKKIWTHAGIPYVYKWCVCVLPGWERSPAVKKALMLSLISYLQGVRTAHPWCCWQRPCSCPCLCCRKSKAGWGGQVKTILKIPSLNIGVFYKTRRQVLKTRSLGENWCPRAIRDNSSSVPPGQWAVSSWDVSKWSPGFFLLPRTWWKIFCKRFGSRLLERWENMSGGILCLL